MAMTARTLVNVTITDISDHLPVYHACPDCYSKLAEGSSDCPKCRRLVDDGATTYRYCLRLAVTDSSMSTDVTVFGSSLNTLLGAPPKQMQLLLEKRHNHDKSDIWLQTLKECLIGRKVIVGIKTKKSSMNPNITLSKILNTLVNKHESLVATQIFPITKDGTTFYEALDMKLRDDILISSPKSNQISRIELKSCERITRRAHFLLPSSGHFSLPPSATSGQNSPVTSSIDSLASCESRGYGIEYLSSDLSEISRNLSQLTLERSEQYSVPVLNQKNPESENCTSRKTLNYSNSDEVTIMETNSTEDLAPRDNNENEIESSQVTSKVLKQYAPNLEMTSSELNKEVRGINVPALNNVHNSDRNAIKSDSKFDDSTCSDDDSDIFLLRYVHNIEHHKENKREKSESESAPGVVVSTEMRTESCITEVDSEMKVLEKSRATVTAYCNIRDSSNFKCKEGAKSTKNPTEGAPITVIDSERFSQDFDFSFSSWNEDSVPDHNENVEEMELNVKHKSDVLDDVPDSENVWEFLDKCEHSETLKSGKGNEQYVNCVAMSKCEDDISSRKNNVLNSMSSSVYEQSDVCATVNQDNGTHASYSGTEKEENTVDESVGSEISESLNNSDELFDCSEELFDSSNFDESEKRTSQVFYVNSSSDEHVPDSAEDEKCVVDTQVIASQSLFSDNEDFEGSLLNTSTPVDHRPKKMNKNFSGEKSAQVFHSLRRTALRNSIERKMTRNSCVNDNSSVNYSGDLFE